MSYDKSSLTVAQEETYDALVAALKAAKTFDERQQARDAAMNLGDGGLSRLPAALAAAESEAGTSQDIGQMILDQLRNGVEDFHVEVPGNECCEPPMPGEY